MKHTTYIKAGNALFFLATVVFILSCHGKRKKDHASQAEPVHAEVITIYPGEAEIEQSFPASLQGKNNVQLRPQISGYIDKIYVDEGTYVNAGQPLFRINASVYREQKNTALAALGMAKSQLTSAKLELDKYKVLTERKVVAGFQYRKASANYENALAALQSELEVLKLQLDPHFLFNNFSILTQLIETNKEAAQEFLSNLSKVYRYILTASKKDVVSLDTELKFVDTYFHLIRIRHGATIHLSVNVSDAEKRRGIPPVTLQLLLENAIKHNISTLKQPLYISITGTDTDRIIVKNNLQRINIDYKSTGMGLNNIKERYQLLEGKAPEIMETPTSFEVQLPLLNI